MKKSGLSAGQSEPERYPRLQRADLRRVEFIKCMRGAGLPIEALTQYMNLVMQGDKTIEARKILIDQRDLLVARIQEMQKISGPS